MTGYQQTIDWLKKCQLQNRIERWHQGVWYDAVLDEIYIKHQANLEGNVLWLSLNWAVDHDFFEMSGFERHLKMVKQGRLVKLGPWDEEVQHD